MNITDTNGNLGKGWEGCKAIKAVGCEWGITITIEDQDYERWARFVILILLVIPSFDPKGAKQPLARKIFHTKLHGPVSIR